MDVVRISRDSARCCFFSMCEEDVQAVIAHPRAMIGTDSGVNPQGASYHPRLKGAFPRAIARYVREKEVVSLPEMIRKNDRYAGIRLRTQDQGPTTGGL